MVSDEQFITAIKNNTNIQQTLLSLNQSVSGASFKVAKNRIKRLNIDISHFTTKRTSPRLARIHYSEILVDDYDRRCSATKLRRALIESGRKHICEVCNIDKWKEKPIVLEVHHIDGNWRNNVKENLQFLCPNCHSQTSNFYEYISPTYCSCGQSTFNNNVKCPECNSKLSIIRKTRQQIDINKLYEYTKTKTIKEIANIYNVNENTIRVWCNKYSFTVQKHPSKVVIKLCECGNIKCSKSLRCRQCNINLSRQLFRKIDRPSKEELEKLVWEKPMTKVGLIYNVSDNTIKDWCKDYKIDRPKQGYWLKKENKMDDVPVH